jgi:hypothetical protein
MSDFAEPLSGVTGRLCVAADAVFTVVVGVAASPRRWRACAGERIEKATRTEVMLLYQEACFDTPVMAGGGVGARVHAGCRVRTTDRKSKPP